MTRYLCADGPLAGQLVDIGTSDGLVLRGGPPEYDGLRYHLENEVLYWEVGTPEKKEDDDEQSGQ